MTMPLTFDWTEIKQRGRGLSFNDVLVVPKRSEVRSRLEPSLNGRLTRQKRLDLPIVSANMDTVTELDMALAMAREGACGILHRFMPIARQVEMVEKLADANLPIIAASVGVHREETRERAQALVAAGCNVLTIDIAHGHSLLMEEVIKDLKDRYPEVELIAGNIATPEAAHDLIRAGADALKVGIGPGSMCTTRIITGCGVPQLTAIALCSEVARDSDTPIIADGGLRTSGDILKAFAAGADCVMLGSMLAGTIETPGEIKAGRKPYRGMASKAAQTSWRGGVPKGMAAEGESTYVAIKGHVRDVLSEIAGGIRSGMSYINANELSEIAARASFIEMTSSGLMESVAHGLISTNQ